MTHFNSYVKIKTLNQRSELEIRIIAMSLISISMLLSILQVAKIYLFF